MPARRRPGPVVNLKYGNAGNAQTISNRFNQSSAEAVAQRTNNPIKVEIFAGTLGGEQRLIEGMALGTIDIYNGAYTGTREFDIFYSPSSSRTAPRQARAPEPIGAKRSEVSRSATSAAARRRPARPVGALDQAQDHIARRDQGHEAARAADRGRGRGAQAPRRQPDADRVQRDLSRAAERHGRRLRLRAQPVGRRQVLRGLQVRLSNAFGEGLDKEAISVRSWGRLSDRAAARAAAELRRARGDRVLPGRHRPRSTPTSPPGAAPTAPIRWWRSTRRTSPGAWRRSTSDCANEVYGAGSLGAGPAARLVSRRRGAARLRARRGRARCRTPRATVPSRPFSTIRRSIACSAWRWRSPARSGCCATACAALERVLAASGALAEGALDAAPSAEAAAADAADRDAFVAPPDAEPARRAAIEGAALRRAGTHPGSVDVGHGARRRLHATRSAGGPMPARSRTELISSRNNSGTR